jgi:hypothetical protein
MLWSRHSIGCGCWWCVYPWVGCVGGACRVALKLVLTESWVLIWLLVLSLDPGFGVVLFPGLGDVNPWIGAGEENVDLDEFSVHNIHSILHL